MAEMALGYGSEYQLLRYLGHHRMFLNNQIKTAICNDLPIYWYDYPNDFQRDSLDGEWSGINFLSDREDFETIKSQWKQFWPTSGNAQSWDGIFEQDGVLYLVEAKAHIKEMESRCQASAEESKKKIYEAFLKTTGSEEQAKIWIESNHYQLANRIAFLHFCNMIGLKAKLCYIMFVNGYLANATKNVTSVDSFKKAWNEECEVLKLSQNQLQNIVTVYIDCTKDK